MRKRTTSFVRLLIFTLLTLSTGAVWGQVSINSVIAQSPVHFAENSDFSVGELTVSFNMPTGKTSGELQVNLAAGIEYMPGTVTATGATVSLKTGSTDANKPVFTLTGASGSVTVKFKRKATKAVLTNPALGSGLQDEAVLTVQGLAPSKAVKNEALYQLLRPTLAVQLPTTQTDVLGARTETFDIRNTGQGEVRDVYFSIAYPPDVVGNSVSYNGSTLTAVGTVPTGLPNAGKPIYKIPNANLANNNGAVVITEKYTVNKCTTGRQNIYYAYWGSSFSDIFESQFNTKNINVTTGKPIIGYDANKAFTYFKWGNGFCGNVLGTFYVRYNNSAATPKGIAYNLKFLLIEMENNVQFAMFEPVNIRLIARDGSSVPLTATLAPADRREIKLNNLAVLSDTALGAKDVGLTDEDSDGFRDDLKQGAYIQMAFDLKKKEGIKCLEPGKGSRSIFSISPGSYVYYDEACGNEGVTGLQAFAHNTLRVFLAGVNDASKLPEEQVQNVPSAGYIAPGAEWLSFGTKKQLENAGVQENEYDFKYVVTTPAGVKLQNVKLYRRTNFFGSSAETPLSQPDVAAGTTATFTTTNTASYRDLTAGYLSFDALLENCNGQTNKPITYSIYLRLRNGDGTYCEVPLVCNHTKIIPAICRGTNCSDQGPTIVSTKVERADNSYGWKDHTMAVRQTRDQVSPLERMRALYLDDIEFISEGEQHVGRAVNNLYYYVKVENTAQLTPKKITLKVNGGVEQSFTATANNPVKGTNAAGKKFFRWDLTSLLPSATLPAGATFTTVATYQVMNNNPTNNNSTTKDVQSGIESFFYTLNNPATDTAIGAEGYHTAQKRCGTALKPVFYIAETFHLLATNRYNGFAGCNTVDLGSSLIYGARRFNTSGAYFTQEFRPARFIKKITMRMPSAYQIKSVNYKYTTKVSYMTQMTVDMNKFTLTDDGTWKTYTYINPPQGQPGHLPPGMISVQNQYNEQVQAFIQPSCKAKTIDITKSETQQDADALALQERIDSNIEYEDFYYHYASTGTSVTAVDYLNNRPILFDQNKKPEVKIEATSQLTVKANKREMEATFKLVNSKNYDAPYGWISIPDVTGIEVLSLQEGTNTYTPQTSITGEKMFFLSEKGNDGKILKNTSRQFKLKYKVTNCAVALQLKVYAGWNCNGNPTTGYRNTCSDKFITYNITVAQSKKEIRADATNPGESNPDKKGSIPMCMATPYSYVINSADEGDLYDAKLVVTPANGITFSDIQVEYPLNSGKVYNTNTPVDGKIIGHTTLGNKHIYDLSSVLPDGSLPGSISEPTIAEKRQLKLTFKVRPDCEFSSGSSFDIDIEGNNLCGSPAEGDKTKAIIAGIVGANVPDYGVQITMDKDLVGNLSSCGNSQIITITAVITHPNPLYQLNSTEARVHVRIPKGYELKSLDFTEPPVLLLPPSLYPGPTERKEDEEKVIGDEQELVFTIPKYALPGYIVGWILELQQKDDAKVPCDPSKIKAFASDRVTGITCNGQACPTLPRLITSTTVEKNLINQRPALSFTDLNITSAAKSGKEELTIKYKLSNAVTTTNHAADLPATQQVKIDLYKDTNNNGRFDAADTKLSTTPYTFQEAVVEGASSSEKTITALVDQGDVCRLLLVINNDTNKCLCKDVYTQLAPPATLTNLVPNLTVCESETKKVAYSAAGASYDQYTWTGKTANDKLDYLSATNVKEPNIHYNGTKLTATQTFTYILTVKRTNGCEATQEVKITVQPAPSISTQPIAPAAYCQGVTATALTVTANTHGVAGTLSYQWYSNTTNSTTGGTPVGTNANSYVPLTTTTLYYYVKITTCGEVFSDVVKVEVKPTPDKPTIDLTAESCTAATVAKISNYVSSGVTYTFTKADDTPVTGVTIAADGVLSGLAAGTYKVKAEKDGCTSDISDSFEIKAQKAVPVKPTVTLTVESCAAPTKAVISNYVSGQTYWNGATQLTVDGTSHEITGLAAGTYTITAKNNDNCESVASDSFVIKAQKAVPAQPIVTLTAESCATPTKAVISNYVPGQTYWNGATQLTVDNTRHEITGLAVGTYTITAKNNDNCESIASDSFEIKAQKVVPVQPTVTLTAESCAAPTKAVISNYVSGQTYWNGATQLTVDGTSHEITGLAAGTYTITAKNNDNCESVASDSFEIKAQKAAPVQPTVTLTAESCVAPTKAVISNYVSGQTYWNGATQLTVDNTSHEIIGLAAGTYTITAKNNDNCESVASDSFEIKAQKAVPAKPTIDLTAESCAAPTKAVISDYVPGQTYWNGATQLTVDNTRHEITGLAAGTYTITAKNNDNCESVASDSFEIKAQKAAPVQPTVTLTAESCVAPTKAVISNYVSGQTYWNGATQLTVDNTSHEITGLAAGTYTITAKNNDNCESVSSDSFVIKAQKAATIIGANPQSAVYVKDTSATPLTAAATGEGTLTYKWYENTTNSYTGGTEVGGNNTYTPATDTVGSLFYWAEITGECGTEKTSIAEIKVTAPDANHTIEANDDPETQVVKGGEVDVLHNDKVDGNPATPTNVDITIPIDGGLTGITINPATGKIKIPTDATPGAYDITYQICVRGATAPCDTAKVRIIVTEDVVPTPTINANDDPETQVAKGGVVDVLSNDRVNGDPATAANVDITIANDGGLTGVTADPATGKIKVPDNATPATYDVEYRICVKGATSPCDTAKAKITVTPDATPSRAIKAVDDDFGKVPNTMDYTTTNTVFSTGVDTLEGVPGILSPETDVILHKGAVTRQDGTAVQDGTVTMNDNGSITVKQGTPVGVYTYTYTICEKAVPTNCSEEAKVTFEVVDNTILAKDDEFEIGTLGGLTPSILNNDIFAGKVGPTTNEMIIEKTSRADNEDPKLKMRFVDGRVDVEKGIAPGPHKYYYTISDKNDKTKNSSAVVTIRVVTFTAGDDEHELPNNNDTKQYIDKSKGIFANDEVDGERPEPGKNVTFRSIPVKDKDGNDVPGIVINQEDGSITIEPNTPDGVYTYSYTICKIAAPNECKTAKGVLKLLPALKAVDDDFTATPVNTTKGAVNVGNVLANDEYAGKNALDHLDKVTATIGENNGGISDVKIDEQGNLIIPQGTPVGVYDLEYNLCMKEHPGVCKTAKVRVEVIKDKPLTIYNGVSADADGHNDYFKIDGIEYYPKNNLKIFNRWGVLVYEKDGYSNEAPFDGHSNGRATISADSKLPQGTYYYILEYEDSHDQSHTEKGWLYLKY